MSIWEHISNDDSIPNEEVSGYLCRFCRTNLVRKQVNDIWSGVACEAEEIHKKTVLDMADVHGNSILDEINLMDAPDEHEAELGCCPACGWWFLSKQVYISTKNQYWVVEFTTASTIKKFDVSNINAPIDEIRKYLMAKYETRFLVNPRKFEQVVGSVFADLGYCIEVTGFSSDGGIDVVLNKGDSSTIGVQVKRYKHSIKVGQIRELLGALVLGGHTRGIFVTTSSYQSGSKLVPKLASNLGKPIELIDAEGFLKLLRTAQVADFDHYPKFPKFDASNYPQLRFSGEYHLNPL